MKLRPPATLPLLVAAALPWIAATPARAQATGSLDPGFAPAGAFTVIPPDSAIAKYVLVEAVAVQADGKILAGGQFDTFDGVPRSGILRFNTDGSLDTGFDPGTGVYSGNPDLFANVDNVAVQADGKIVIGGFFDRFNGALTYGLARLNPDGSLDTGFAANALAINGASAVLQPDGKILAITTSQQYSAADELVRLNADGTTDTGFAGIPGGQYLVNAAAVQADGKILVSGDFGTLYGPRRRYLARLNADGSLDKSFRLKANPFDSTTAGVGLITLQADGKILVTGNFTEINRVARAGFARLNADGSLDTSFDAALSAGNASVGGVSGVVVQSDGKIVIVGGFKKADGVKRHRVARLNADGSLDTSFNPRQGPNNNVYSVALQADGKIVVGGFFTAIDSVSYPEIARLQ